MQLCSPTGSSENDVFSGAMAETMGTYLVHDNGGRPFKVTVRGSDVRVHRKVIDAGQGVYEDQPALKLKAKKVFIGSDKGRYRGNTILVQTGEESFVFIGESIFSFQAKNPKKYVSPVGNSDVPYPYLVTEDSIYLMLSDHYKLPVESVPKGEDPYMVHWGYVDPLTAKPSRKRTSKKKSRGRAPRQRKKAFGVPFKVKVLHKRHFG
jgi:hypothetical protein